MDPTTTAPPPGVEIPAANPHAAVRERAAKIARTPSAIRAVLAANADPDVLERFDKYLDLAYSECLPSHDSRPLEAFIARWWWAAVQWSDPVSHRAMIARAAEILRDGPPAGSLTREQIREKYGHKAAEARNPKHVRVVTFGGETDPQAIATDLMTLVG